MLNKLLTKRNSILTICGVALITIFFISYTALNLRFDYDFDSFFSEKDSEFSTFKSFRDTYENDNDYLLLAIPNYPTVFDLSLIHI